MVKRFSRSKSDIENLSKFRTLKQSDEKPMDYKGWIVNKPWGYEYLMFENQSVAVWVLCLKPRHSTSIHCHPNKKTSLIIVSGALDFSTLEDETTLKAGDGVIIEEGVFHTSCAVSVNGSVLLEVESPPNKSDLVRLKDEYGRENAGYEGQEKMSREKKNYDYIDFHKHSKSDQQTRKLMGSYLTIGSSEGKFDDLMIKSGHIFCLLEGDIESNNFNLKCGEMAHFSEIKRNWPLQLKKRSTYLVLH